MGLSDILSPMIIAYGYKLNPSNIQLEQQSPPLYLYSGERWEECERSDECPSDKTNKALLVHKEDGHEEMSKSFVRTVRLSVRLSSRRSLTAEALA